MKITKISGVDVRENSDGNSKKLSRITKIVPAIKTPGRYNIFIDGVYSFSLDEIQLVAAGLKKGQEIPDTELFELKNDSEFGKNYIRAVDLISRRVRSEKEIRDYAWHKQWTKENTEKVIARLRERGYLNDETFAKSFVASRANLRNFSRRKMELELAKKGINKDIREKVLRENEDFSEDESLKNLIAKKRNHYDSEQKLIAYLARQGFSYDKIKVVLNEERNAG